jgi:hypothetical protein
VPDPPAHAGAAVTFSLPEAALRAGLASVASGDSEEEAAARESLLVKAGAFSVEEGEEGEEGEEEGGASARALQFELKLGTPPAVLAGISGVMCCAGDEAMAMAKTFAPPPPAEDDAGDAGADDWKGEIFARVTPQSASSSSSSPPPPKSIRVQLCDESKRRAGKYLEYVLGQVEPIVCGGLSDEDARAMDVPEEVDAATWAAAIRVRAGAVAVFRSVDAFTSETADKAWIERAVYDLIK